MSGYALRRALTAAAGTFWSESYGQIYPALLELRRRGWARRIDDPGAAPGSRRAPPRRARHLYEITAKGEGALLRWLAEPPRTVPPRRELLLKLYLGDRDMVDAPAAWVRRLLLDETERLRHVRRMMETLPRGAHGHRSLRHWLMSLEFVAMQSEASIAWCQRTLATLGIMQEAAARRRTAAQHRSPME
jgi:DNA-binding PadR family transcriptional regulator